MEKQILVYEDIVHGGYAVMTVWAKGSELKDIKHIEDIQKYESLDDVRKMREALDKILIRWGDNKCTKQ